MAKNVTIRPFARLLTMLGDQLIKNEQIAVIELIKNAYDADADWVKVSFEGFTESLNITSESRIIIEDNGCGMTSERIEKSWMSPATPNKFSKDGSERRKNETGIIIRANETFTRTWIIPYLHLAGYSRQVTLFYWQRSADHAKTCR